MIWLNRLFLVFFPEAKAEVAKAANKLRLNNADIILALTLIIRLTANITYK